MVDPPNQSQRRVGIEISSSGLYAAVLENNNEIAATRSVLLDGSDNSVSELISLIQALKTEFGGFDRFGVAVPGLVDRASGRVALSANIPGHAEVDLVEDLKAATGMEIVLENDANAAAYGEFSLGAGRGSQNMFFATLGEGIGGAFIFNGEIWRGASGFAGEFGYIPINSEGKRLQDVASSANIIRRTRSRFHQDSTSSLNKLAEEAITLAEIITAAQNDDDFAQMMLKRTGIYIGTGIASVINLLNIEKVVIGGEIMQAKHLVLDAIVERTRKLSFEPSFRSTTIVESELGASSAAVGAALIGGQTR